VRGRLLSVGRAAAVLLAVAVLWQVLQAVTAVRSEPPPGPPPLPPGPLLAELRDVAARLASPGPDQGVRHVTACRDLERLRAQAAGRFGRPVLSDEAVAALELGTTLCLQDPGLTSRSVEVALEAG
jgi:hypothetical protein